MENKYEPSKLVLRNFLQKAKFDKDKKYEIISNKNNKVPYVSEKLGIYFAHNGGKSALLENVFAGISANFSDPWVLFGGEN